MFPSGDLQRNISVDNSDLCAESVASDGGSVTILRGGFFCD